MKLRLICLSLLSIALITSCSRDNNSTGNENVYDGTWRVTLFKDSGNDETTDFSGYTFSFGTDGKLTAAKSGTSQTGTWSRTSSDFNIDLGAKSDTNKPLGELSDDWNIISITDTEIKLGDDNPASGEFLTFTKN